MSLTCVLALSLLLEFAINVNLQTELAINTHVIVSGVHHGVVNTHAMVSEIHRSVVKGEEGTDNQHRSVSDICASFHRQMNKRPPHRHKSGQQSQLLMDSLS